MSVTTQPATPGRTRLAFTTSEAARYLGVSVATVRRWSNDGHLVGYRTPGGQRRFSHDQLDAFVQGLSRAERRGGHKPPSHAAR